MFSAGSRYQSMSTYEVTTKDGRKVTAVRLPLPVPGVLLGYHRRSSGQRLDHIAYHYLNDATTFWRLCDVNNSMSPDSLAARDLVGIPQKA
jgi:hypothetical protein